MAAFAFWMASFENSTFAPAGDVTVTLWTPARSFGGPAYFRFAHGATDSITAVDLGYNDLQEIRFQIVPCDIITLFVANYHALRTSHACSHLQDLLEIPVGLRIFHGVHLIFSTGLPSMDCLQM